MRRFICIILFVFVFFVGTCDNSGLHLPSGVNASDGNFYNKIVVTWSTVESAMAYLVYRSTSLYREFIEIGSADTSCVYHDRTVRAGIKYFYKVRSWSHHDGLSGFSDTDSGYTFKGSNDDSYIPVDCEDCICKADKDCNANEFCHFPECKADTGRCRERPEVCPSFVDSVISHQICGCDDKTYIHLCYAALAGESVNYTGECIPVLSNDAISTDNR